MGNAMTFFLLFLPNRQKMHVVFNCVIPPIIVKLEKLCGQVTSMTRVAN